MMREVTVIIFSDGRLAFEGDDLPDFEALVELIGPQPIDEVLAELGLDPALNSHLCG